MNSKPFRRLCALLPLLLILSLLAPKCDGGHLPSHASTGKLRKSNRSRLPTLPLQTLEGGTLSIGDLRGRVVLVNLWSSWCSPCVEELPSVQQLHESMKGKAFTLITVNMGEEEQNVRTFVKNWRYTFPVLLDPGEKLYDLWDVNNIPLSILLDKGGRPRYEAVGSMEWNSPGVHRLIEELMAETPQTGAESAKVSPDSP